MSLRLSFIVPFYNVEPYIEECIRSLYAQDIPLEDYEVICVDDCSHDGSRAIVERLQLEYPTLYLLTTPENLRQGGARNIALDVARGKYVWFVDSDDYIKPNCLIRLLTLAEKENLDILDFDYDTDITVHISYKNVEPFNMGPCTGSEYVFYSKYTENWSWRCSCVWGGIIRRDMIRDLRFQEKVQFEDTDYAIEMYARAIRLMHIADKPYFYRYVPHSTTHVSSINKSLIFYRVEATKRLIQLYKTLDIPQWRSALRELIRSDVYDFLQLLRNTTFFNQLYFYRKRMGNDLLPIKSFVGKKSMLALKSWLMLHVFYSKK